MKSRYSYMLSSQVKDTDGDNFPDPLSTTYNDIQLTSIPPLTKLSSADLDKFWLFMADHYGITYDDDILLNINGVPYLGTLLPGDEIFLINQKDIDNYHTQKLSTSGGD